LVLALIGILPSWYKIGKWTTLGEAFPDVGATLGTTVWAFAFVLVLTGIGLAFMKRLSAAYIPAFIVIFALAFLAFFLGKLNTKALWGVTGVPYVIWAIVLGLLISNLLGVPKWLKAGIMTEYFIKIGLVCMGAAMPTGWVEGLACQSASLVSWLPASPSAAFRRPLLLAAPSKATPRKLPI
jgi:hypothetical protein